MAGVAAQMRASATGKSAPVSAPGWRAAMMRRVSRRLSAATSRAMRICPMVRSAEAARSSGVRDSSPWSRAEASAEWSRSWMEESPCATVSWMSAARRARSSSSPARRDISATSARAASSSSMASARVVASRNSMRKPRPTISATAAPRTGPATPPTLQPPCQAMVPMASAVSTPTNATAYQPATAWSTRKKRGNASHTPSGDVHASPVKQAMTAGSHQRGPSSGCMRPMAYTMAKAASHSHVAGDRCPASAVATPRSATNTSSTAMSRSRHTRNHRQIRPRAAGSVAAVPAPAAGAGRAAESGSSGRSFTPPA